MVYAVLKKVKEELVNKAPVPFNDGLTNDTIYNLLRIRFKQPDSETEAIGNFHYLTKLGLHLSAYNLLYEARAYANFNWDREKLKASLNTGTTHCCPSPLIPDNTK